MGEILTDRPPAEGVVLVTGATRGIGLAVAEAYLAAGATVVGVGRNGPELRGLADRFGPRFIPKIADLSRRASLVGLCRWLEAQPVDALICNAGANKIDSIGELDPRDWDRLVELNLTAAALLSKAAARSMTRRRYGRIVHVSSIYGLVSKRGRAAYSSTKAGLIGLARASALDLAGTGILVNAVCPGFTDTELTRSILRGAERKAVIASIPLGRMAAPEEIARLVLYLGTRQNTYITGQAVAIDGGVTAG